MSSPKVSVCIPVFNGQEFINEAIDSVLKQSYHDFEIIIVDNKSTDSTFELIKAYTDTRIKVFQNETNIGMIPNWNKCLEYATGEYIKMLPADDFIYPDCLKIQVEILEGDKEKKISLVSSKRHVINDSGKVLLTRGFSNKRVQLSGTDAINKIIRSGGNTIGEGGAILFRREILAKTGVFVADIFYVLDIDLWFRILLHGDLYATPDIVSSFRISASSESVKIANKQKQDNVDFIKKIYNDKRFKLSKSSYRIGLIKTSVLTQVKKIIYKFIVK